MTVALHPERTADPATLRWSVRTGVPRVPEASDWSRLWRLDAAAALDPLTESGVLAGHRAEPGLALTTLAQGRDWPTTGPHVRDALHAAALAHAARLAAAGQDERDGLLALAAARVVAQEVGPLAASHGGALEVVSVHDGVVRVALGGRCQGCPAAAVTLQGRLETALRAAAPWLVAVEPAEGPRRRWFS